MNCQTTLCLLIALLCSPLWAETNFRLEKYAPQTGHRHANFSLPSVKDGKRISLSDFKGKKVLLLHFASW